MKKMCDKKIKMDRMENRINDLIDKYELDKDEKNIKKI